MEDIWLRLAPGKAFNYNLMESYFDVLYAAESLQESLLNLFSILALVVTGLGLYGLAAYTTRRWIKEVAIRRVLGASVGRVCLLLINQFTVFVVIANALACGVDTQLAGRFCLPDRYADADVCGHQFADPGFGVADGRIARLPGCQR